MTASHTENVPTSMNHGINAQMCNSHKNSDLFSVPKPGPRTELA